MPAVSFGPLHFIEGSRSRILNIVCIVAVVSTTAFAFIGRDSAPYMISMISLSVVFCLAFVLNYFLKQLLLTEYLITILSTVWLIYMAVAFGKEMGVQNYFIIALVAWSIFSTKKILKIVVVISLIILMTVLNVYQIYNAPVFPLPKAIDTIFAFNVVTPLLMIAFMCGKFVRDIIKAQETIEQQKDELAESNKFKDRVFSIIGHDMRSPFNSAKGLVELLDSNILTDEERETVLEELRSNIDVSLQTLDNILGWASQSYYGSVMNSKTKPEALNMHAIVNKNITLYSHIAAQKNIRFNNNVPVQVSVLGDKEQISFVLRNLTSNALKFSYPGKAISFGTWYEDGDVVISIQDEGVGMSKESIASLFKIDTRFSKEGTTKEKGTGLGLIFCQEFVQNNNGRLWIESEPGKGTTVYLSLPKAEAGELVG